MATVGNTATRKFNHSNSAKDKGAFLSRDCNFQMKLEELHLNLMLSFLFKMNFGVFRKIFCKNQQTVLVLVLQITGVVKISYKR